MDGPRGQETRHRVRGSVQGSRAPKRKRQARDFPRKPINKKVAHGSSIIQWRGAGGGKARGQQRRQRSGGTRRRRGRGCIQVPRVMVSITRMSRERPNCIFLSCPTPVVVCSNASFFFIPPCSPAPSVPPSTSRPRQPLRPLDGSETRAWMLSYLQKHASPKNSCKSAPSDSFSRLALFFLLFSAPRVFFAFLFALPYLTPSRSSREC